MRVGPARPPAAVRRLVPGRVLAWARSDQGWLAGTASALVLAAEPPWSLPWEQVQVADWQADDERLHVTEVGTFGQPRAVHAFALEEPRERLLQLVRERVTATVVLHRRVEVGAGRGAGVLARRNPAGGPLHWLVDYDDGVDPDDPAVTRLVQAALAAARDEVGDTS